MWERSDIGIPGGHLRRWVLHRFSFGPIWLNYHDNCCKEIPQRVWLLTVEDLGIRNEELPLAKDGDEAKTEALVRVKFKLDKFKAEIVEMLGGES